MYRGLVILRMNIKIINSILFEMGDFCLKRDIIKLLTLSIKKDYGSKSPKLLQFI